MFFFIVFFFEKKTQIINLIYTHHTKYKKSDVCVQKHSHSPKKKDKGMCMYISHQNLKYNLTLYLRGKVSR